MDTLARLENLEEVLDELPQRLIPQRRSVRPAAFGSGGDRRDRAAKDRVLIRFPVPAHTQPVRRYGELDEGRTAAALYLSY